MLPKELQVLYDSLPKESQQLFTGIIAYFEQRLKEQDVVIKSQASRIKELEDQLCKNSSNSSKPPSSDGLAKPSPKSTRKKSDKKAGGQKGHKGTTLKMVENPDKTMLHQVCWCESCQRDLSKVGAIAIDRRQVYDLPLMKMLVIEHQSESKKCKCGHITKAEFPQGVDRYIGYGSNIKGLITYLQNYQLLPYDRTKELVQDLFGHSLSTGTLANINQKAFDRLDTFEENLKSLLHLSSLAGFDETGFRVLAKRLWLHSCSTNRYAYYAVHQKRGREAMDDIGILPKFKGTAIHDFWKSYFHYDCKHGLCNAHTLRELIFVKERFEQNWAEQLRQLLLKMKQAKQKAILQGKTALSKATLKKYRQTFESIVEQGFEQNPFKPPKVKKRGRPKKSPPLNLLTRLKNHTDDYLRFLYDFKVPFDNNFSERDIRMMKVKQKISGCFRSMIGARRFARIRSFIVTARKQNVNAFKALTNLFEHQSIPYYLICNRSY